MTLDILHLKKATQKLSKSLNKIKLPDDVFVYNPLDYAEEAFFSYLDKYARAPLKAIFLGMNPGPHGMMQTGIPFGDIEMVRSYLKITTGVERPTLEHPKRPIEGYASERREVSGTRLWSFFKDNFEKPKSFFKEFFVLNYCPLGFLSPTGSNVTPDKLPPQPRKQIEALCDAYLLEVVPLLKSEYLVGIGGYASKVFERLFPEAQVKTLLHPSPASPAANKGWAAIADRQLREAGIL